MEAFQTLTYYLLKQALYTLNIYQLKPKKTLSYCYQITFVSKHTLTSPNKVQFTINLLAHFLVRVPKHVKPLMICLETY